MTFTIKATTKASNGAFVPMITVRGAKGRMVGSYVPKGGTLEFATATHKLAAQITADAMVAKVVRMRPEMFVAA